MEGAGGQPDRKSGRSASGSQAGPGEETAPGHQRCLLSPKRAGSDPGPALCVLSSGSGPEQEFSLFLYDLSQVFVAPFHNIFHDQTPGTDNVFELSALVGAYAGQYLSIVSRKGCES